ncbi:MAG TPA: FAD-binding and (Fe-S)-binding domain-containing protein [Acidisarcina sp.]|nr:FAD-binding and (Fe-S)-binding domain-containing protein [Acidisarcina sp.]
MTTSLTPGEILAALQERIDPARILIREIDRIAFASDASFYRLIPRAVVQPVSTDEVRELFRFSHRHSVPLVFRAGGTSLSGQSITDGVLVDVSRHWRVIRVEQNGKAIRVQPGVIGQKANDTLRLYRAKIGPDPASINSCQLGGILSNNASGMCCGVAQNAYHTLQSLTFVLPSGTEVDTAEPDADARFRELEPDLYHGLLRLKSTIANDPAMVARIRRKYLMKNTTGYGLNAFLDFESPVDIFSHLLIGSEGTLAFVAEAVLNTVPDQPYKYTGLLLFENLHAACAAIPVLKQAGAAALELMDRSSMRSVEDKPGVPEVLRSLPPDAAALLVEFQCANDAERAEVKSRADEAVSSFHLLHPAILTRDPAVQAQFWKIRKGMFPSVGAVRASGTTAIIEDVAFPVERLADAAVDLRILLDRHGYKDAIIFGHAKDGNLHFVITQGFIHATEIRRYREFIDDVVTLVVQKYDGALKAEHGTGRNMAPFVETEWGSDAYSVMREVKALADPYGLLNPGVILNSDPEAHIANLKGLPVVEPEVDKCIECGYCEHKCPSRDLTLTPRQRIVVRREMQRLKDSGQEWERYEALERDFPYMVLDTCAVDGLCATECPVSIDTGTLTKRFRQVRHTSLANAAARTIARNLKLAEIGARFALGMGHGVQRVFGLQTMVAITRTLNRVTRAWMDEPFWQWSKEMPHPRRGPLPVTPRQGARAVYFPACISRIMGALPGESDDTTTMQALLNIAERANVPLFVPSDLTGKCCGVPFSSKGFEAGHRAALNHTIENFSRWSENGALPILVDTSPCTYGLKTARPYLTPENQAKFDRLTILDSVQFASEQILPHLPIHRRVNSVTLHPVCSVTKMGIASELVKIAEACSDEVVVPQGAGCCAFAGDRGFLFPELTASATQDEAESIEKKHCDGYFSSSRTCEIGMTRATGEIYRSYLHLLDYVSRPEA